MSFTNGAYMKLQHTAWIGAIIYSLCIGSFTVPYGLGMTLVLWSVVASVFLTFRKHSLLEYKDAQALLSAATLLALIFFLSTNLLILALTSIGFVICYLGLWYRKVYQADPFCSEWDFTGISSKFLENALINSFRVPGNIKQLLQLLPSKTQISLSKPTLFALLFVLPVMYLFHLLFASVNVQYADALRSLFQMLWNLIVYVINFKFIFALCIQSYFFFVCLKMWQNSSEQPVSQRDGLAVNLLVFIVPLVLLCGFFSYYQLNAIATMELVLTSFKNFSLYTQHGFWELLVAGSLGYLAWLWCFYRQRNEGDSSIALWVLLLIFVAELFLISCFAAHKLIHLQLAFGLKDQRMLASLATGLIAGTFLLSGLRLFQRVSDSNVVRLQIGALLSSIIVLGLINTESLITKISPISYYIDGKRIPDYSYLLTNSFDNSSEWESLMNQAKVTGIKYPADYYWGFYLPLCLRFDNRVSHFSFQQRIEWLKAKYGTMFSEPSLQKVLTFHWREFQAFRFTQDKSERVKDFIDFVQSSCAAAVESN